jgi:hypothetical protein
MIFVINIYNVLVLLNMNNAIVNSFRHCGIYPFEKAKMIKMITNEQLNQMLFQNIHVEATFNLVSQHMNTLESFKIEKRKRESEEKNQKKKAKCLRHLILSLNNRFKPNYYT